MENDSCERSLSSIVVAINRDSLYKNVISKIQDKHPELAKPSVTFPNEVLTFNMSICNIIEDKICKDIWNFNWEHFIQWENLKRMV